MKNFNLIKRLFMDSHEKQSPQRFARYAAMLIMLLTIGVGQMWGGTITSDGTARLFFKMNAVSWWNCGTNGNQNFAYFYGTSGSAWSAHSAQQTGNYYYVVVPAGTWDHVILTRNSVTTSPSWDNKYNQTGDIAIENGKNYISAFSEGSATATWSTYQLESTASLSASKTSMTTAESSTLTPSLTSNTDYNVIKSTSYSVTTNPGSAGSVTSGGVFTATAAGTYTVTATITYNAKGFSSITKTVSPTVTITVSAAAETTHTVTITYKCGSTAVSTQTSQNVGEVTASSITAPAVDGYTFSSWTLSNGLSNQSGSTTANPISIKTKASGTYTLQANYTEDLSSPWVLKGGTNITGDNWATEHAMTKKTGHSTENVAYYTANISSTNSGISGSADAWSFKLIKNSEWYGLFASGSYWWGRGNSANQPLTGEQNIQICADVAGTYEIKVDYSTSTPKVTVTFPTKYSVTYSVSPSGAANAITTSPSVTSGGSVAAGTSMTFTHATAKTGYSWYRWENGSGSSLGTGSTYTTTINANTTVVAKYTENTYNVTATASAGGSATPTSATSMGQVTGGDITASPNTGYNFVNWTITSGSGYFGSTGTSITSTTANTKFRPSAAATIKATFAPKQTTITLNDQGATTPGSTSVTATYDAAMPEITLPEKTGYTFGGYWGAPGGSGPQYYNADGSSTQNWNNENDTYTLHAKWTPISYTVVLDKQTSAKGYGGNAGTVENQTVTFDATPATVSGTMPTAAQGYGFMGFYSEVGGNGRRFIDPSGNWVTSAGDTISGGKWVHADDVTLYAYYKKAEITALTLDNAIVAQSVPNGVKVTPTVEPTPAGTTHIDWRVLYSNGNPLASQPSMSVYNTKGVQFTSPETSGTYLIEAVLRTGSTAKAGTTIDSTTASFQVAGTHTVTIRYQDASGNTIQASGSVAGRPLAWSDDITAPDIFGYTFARWDAGDGVTIKDGSGADKTTSTSATIKIKAVYDGRLTAVYNKKSMIYFKNTLGWSNVYFHKSYWDNSQGGAGNKGQTRNRPMSLVPGETDIYYWEGTPGTDVAFTNAAYGSGTSGEGGYQAFWAGGDGAAVVFPSNPDCSSSANTYYGYNAGTPMFVPIAQEGQEFNKGGGGKAVYYNKGYWRYYDPVNGEEGATGYTLKIYNKTEDAGRVELSSTSFTNADVTGQLFKATVNLEAAGGYGVKILRNNSMLYTNTTGHLHRTGDVVVTERGDDNYQAIWIKATAAGDYDFIITCNGDGKICLQATFPAKNGDYRVLYTDNATWSNSAHTAQTWFHPSRVISAEANAEDTISFYVAKGNTPQYKIEKITEIYEGTGAITWTQVQDWTDISVAATGVYNFKITQNAAGDGISSVENLGEYTGNYYIRTDCAGSTKWDNYKSNDHMMTYSEYSKDHSDYTHYYMKFVKSGTNVKFCIANDYSDCISDTLITHTYRGGDASHVYDSDGVGYKKGDIKADANVRFMWDIRYNKLIRAYLARGKNNGSKFLVLCGQAGELLAPDGSPLTGDSEANPGNNHGGGANNMQFVDNENWIYEANVKIVPNSYVKLTALFHGSTFYFKGSEGAFDAGHAIQLMTGSGSAELVRVIYDFKTDRLLAAWQPSGNISTVKEINADVMFVREHQGDITQLTFSKGEGEVMGAITKIETAYAVLRFNKWTINNKSKADGHAPLSPLLSRYERDLFYVSFPFRVSMNEVFGFGTYGKHWIIEEYDGATRAAKGYWAESAPNWKFIWDRKGKFFEPNQGYIIALELDEMGEESDVWANGVQNVELYFPSYGTMGDITNASVTYEIPEHECTINRSDESNGHGGTLGPQYDRRVKDSHWNVISVPTYVNTDDLTFANTTWITTADDTHVGPNFLYEWNSADNSVTARSGVGYTYHAMHAYLVQYCGNITWSTSVTPAAAPRRNPKYRGNYEFRLEILQNDEAVDQTFVKLSDEEAVTTSFEFNYDLSKEFNKNRSNIYTLIGTEPAAGNVLPLIDQTTVVPVGVIAKTDGDYTFSIPDGTEGIGVTLVDNETGIRTNLALEDYTVALEAGTQNDRFYLEISPIKHVATGVEEITGDGSQVTGARKVMVDGILYIIKDGKVFSTQGARVK